MSKASSAAERTFNSISNTFEKYFFQQNYWMYTLAILGVLFIYLMFFK